MTLTFLGAARTVTGSKHLLEVNGARVLVDCGLFQGLKELRLRNWAPLPVNATGITSVVLTHAHLDHCGYLPRLVNQGFRGRIFCTPATAELTRIVLADAARLQEEDAERANRKGYTKHHPALPLFTMEDASRAMALLQPVGYERPVPVAPGVQAEFLNAGHLLGSSYARVVVESTGRTLLFGGDLGRYNRPVLPDPTPVAHADLLLLESTYGDRLHEADDDGERFAGIVRTTLERGGRLLIPAFALGRVEELLYWVTRLERERRIPTVPVYVDSPMAASVLATYRARVEELDPDIAGPLGETDRAKAFRDMCAFCASELKVVVSIAESRAIQESRAPAIIISASGMATGGRVLHHLARELPDARNTILFAGYQAVGTRGRALVDGAKYTKIHGQDIPVAARIERLDAMSAHADANEILRWLRGFERPPSLTCLVHGEPSAMDALKARIERELGWTIRTPAHQEKIELG
ncbi:MAG: MBL fold metallo-hydrolase [Acidobacteria bacterium]|nr:MBL fold metallo-hydrolase [Acidobacteriota bacterium]